MSIPHPYKLAPASSFWSRAVARNWNPPDLIDLGSQPFLISKQDKVVSAGSCFASNIIPYLEKSGLTYLKTETQHPAFQDMPPEALGYANFSAAYGNIYTARQLLQLFKRSVDVFSPAEDRWEIGDEIVDTLRPGLRYRARSHREFDILTAQHLRKTYEAFAQADVFIFTLGLTEAWVSRIDGTVFPACPGTVAGSFDPERHEFKNFDAAEVTTDLIEFVHLLREVNPDVRIVLTVSPVPLVATAAGKHVLHSTTYSKAVLRVAAEQVSKSQPNVLYFPAYEIITGPQAPWEFYEEDRRSVSQAGIEIVMHALLARCEVAHDVLNIGSMEEAPPQQEIPSPTLAAEWSRRIAEAECEEAMADASHLPAASVQQSADAMSEAAGLSLAGSTEQSPDAMSEAMTEASKPCAVAPAVSIETGSEETVPDPASPVAAWSNPAQDASRQHAADAAAVPHPELGELQEKLAQVLDALAAERAEFDRELERLAHERDARAAESMRWFAAAIAITADHNPLTERHARGRGWWWRSVGRLIGGSRRGDLSPTTLADRACAEGRWELAARYYRDALDLEPHEPRLWFQCGYALRAAGKIFEADVAFRKGLEHSNRRLPSNLPSGQHTWERRDA